MIAAVAALVNVLFILQGPGLVNARLKARLAGDDGYKSVSSGLLQITDTNTSSPDNGVWHTPFFPPLFSWHSLPRVLNVVCRELGFPDGAVFGAIDEGRMYMGYLLLDPRRLEDILCGGEEMGIDECFLRKWSHAEDGVIGYHPLWINCDDGLNSVGVNCYNWHCEAYLEGYYENRHYHCQCDPYCELFGDCCSDHNDPKMMARRRDFFGNSWTSVIPDLAFWSCVDLPFGARVEEGIWLVTKCPQSYQDLTVKQLCEASSNGHVDRPVYDPEGIHFRNVYCALCHGSENTTMWDVCISKSENILNKNETFFYVRPGYSNSSNQLPEEYFAPRPCISNIIRECRPDLKGSFRNIDIACRTLTGDIAEEKGKVFANSNCAICNGALDAGKTCVYNLGFDDTFRHVPWYEKFEIFCNPELKLVNGRCVPPGRAYWPHCKSVSSQLTIEDHQQDQAWDCSGEDANIFRYLEESSVSIGLFTVLHEDHVIVEVDLMAIHNMSRGIDSYIAANPRDTRLLCAPTRIRLDHGCKVLVEHSRESFVQNGEWVHGDLSDFEPVIIGGENLLLFRQRLFLSSTIYHNSTIYALNEDKSGYTKTYSVSVFGVKRDISNCVMAILTPPQFGILTVEANFLIVSRGIFFHPSEYFIFDNDSVLVCLRTPEDVKLFMDRSGFLTITTLGRVGFGISSVSLALTLVTYSLFQELRNLHGLVIINMVLALLLSHILLAFVAEFVTHLPVVCTAIAASSHYFWLATFFWKTVLAFDLCKTLSSDPATALLANSGKVRKFLVYSAVGWGVPFVILATCLGFHFHPWQEESLLRYGVMENADMCWIVQPMANVVAFAIPCAICLCVNGVLFISTMRNMLKVRRQPGNVNGTNTILHKNGWRVDLLIHAKISVLLGFTWISGFVGSFLQLDAMWYVFVIINSLQGVVIFGFFGLNKRVRSLWRGIFCCQCNK